MTLSQEKAALRKAAFVRRKTAHARAESSGSAATVHLLTFLRARAGPGPVAGYLPIRTEIDPRPAMAALVAEGRDVCVPVVDGTGRPLRFRAWAPDCALMEGAFGAMIPVDGAACTPTSLIVPLLSFDAQGGRLGYGGGFYDRTLADLAQKAPVLAVGFAYAGQAVEAVPREATDVCLDAVVTETGVTETGVTETGVTKTGATETGATETGATETGASFTR
ncbi:MAG: 5-formyltetrahydrofolate cyclo-ligase [Pseudomonadota bacterium]